jgi:hypothetical protein
VFFFVKSKLKPGVRRRSVDSASAVRQAQVRFSARHPMEVFLLVSKVAMKIQEDRPRQMMKDERMYDYAV